MLKKRLSLGFDLCYRTQSQQRKRGSKSENMEALRGNNSTEGEQNGQFIMGELTKALTKTGQTESGN